MCDLVGRPSPACKMCSRSIHLINHMRTTIYNALYSYQLYTRQRRMQGLNEILYVRKVKDAWFLISGFFHHRHLIWWLCGFLKWTQENVTSFISYSINITNYMIDLTYFNGEYFVRSQWFLNLLSNQDLTHPVLNVSTHGTLVLNYFMIWWFVDCPIFKLIWFGILNDKHILLMFTVILKCSFAK